MTGKRKATMTLNDILVPGDILQVLRDALDKAPTLAAIIVLTIKKDSESVEVAAAGTASDAETAGYLLAAQLIVLQSDDDD